jgi:hypothetical protein
MVASSLMLIFSSCRVGTMPVHCLDEEPETEMEPPLLPAREDAMQTGSFIERRTPTHRSICHGIAFGLQGIVFLLLLGSIAELPAALVLGSFSLAGIVLAFVWHRWTTMPHAIDMGVGMLTLGNLGMLLGWWADNGFLSLSIGTCCHCVEAMREGVMKPWVFVGMLLGANAAMLWLMRSPRPARRSHVFAMYVGGNLGMVLGMPGGGWCATQFTTDSVSIATVAISFVGMTVGMLAGMFLGTWLFEKGIALARAIIGLPRWLRSLNPTPLASLAAPPLKGEGHSGHSVLPFREGLQSPLPSQRRGLGG